MSKENKSRFVVLGMLSLGPMSGYEIKKRIEGSTNNFWSESYGQLYPTLKQLVSDGLTVSHTEKQEGKPERYIYTLTDKGWETCATGSAKRQSLRHNAMNYCSSCSSDGKPLPA